jgi:hypothetical protein
MKKTIYTFILLLWFSININGLQIEDNRIKIHFYADKHRQISIYDISGRLYYQQDFFSGKEAVIPAAPFPGGNYLLKIYSKDNNQINMHKIIL